MGVGLGSCSGAGGVNSGEMSKTNGSWNVQVDENNQRRSDVCLR